MSNDGNSVTKLTRRDFIDAANASVLALHAGALTVGVGSPAVSQEAGSREVRDIENIWIPMSDGTRLAARLWLPADAEQVPVPAILEYLPYRKRDGTRLRDETMHPYFAQHGYASIRVDRRGYGDSEGLPRDEYVQEELDDGVEIIAWLASQPWCTGNVGMFGKSWGGFNSLQVAAQRPPALKAIITHCASDDRYSDDAHYRGGTVIQANFLWGSQFFNQIGQPPDPEIVGERWRDMWMERLENTFLPVEEWLNHQHRDEFWQHGSVIDDYSDIECAVYAIGGWLDCYSNSVPRLCAGLRTPVKGLVGPWNHVYPHNSGPEPRIDYLTEALRWWDYWLKDIDTGIMDEPVLRVWMQNESVTGGMDSVDGRWVAEDSWPSPRITPWTYHLNESGLGSTMGPEEAITLAPVQTVGQTAPRWGIFGPGSQPTDQRLDDVRSITFDSEPLPEDFEIMGAPVATVELSVDKPVAMISVRLNEVFPDGVSTRVTYAVLNLTHRDSHETPAPLEPGRRYRVPIRLDDIAHRFKRGNRLRVSMSTTYWPHSWPSPEPVQLTVYSGVSTIELPVRPERAADTELHDFGEAFVPERSSQHTVLSEPRSGTHTYTRDIGGTSLTLLNESPASTARIDPIGTIRSGEFRERVEIDDNDPTSATLEYTSSSGFARGNEWNVRVDSALHVSLTKGEFVLAGTYTAFEHGEQVFEKSWDTRMPRQLV